MSSTAKRSKQANATRRHTALQALARGDHLSAQSEYVALLAVDHADVEALTNIAIVFLQTNRWAAALAAARRAVELAPAVVGAWNNLGYILGTMGRFAESVTALETAAELDPAAPLVLHHLGMALHACGRFEAAVNAFDRALALDPDNADIIDQRGLSQLGQGKFRLGLTDNRVRWNVLAVHPLMHAPLPEWQEGESIEGKSILVLHEQGFGDTLQFVRLVPWLKERCGAKRVVLSMPSSLIDLLRLSGLADEVIGIRDEPTGGLASMDYKCPLQTLAARLDLTPETIPGKPYLSAPLRKPVLRKEKRLRVGLVWAGKPMYAQDRWRSMHVATLFPLIERHSDVAFYSLQVDVPQEQELWRVGLNAFVSDLGPQIKDWTDTAALLSELDLLISVDTAPAHLAGAMGKPVALMIPQASCWRWGDHAATTTPWYPSMQLFRQRTQGDWGNVVDEVSDLIGGMAA